LRFYVLALRVVGLTLLGVVLGIITQSDTGTLGHLIGQAVALALLTAGVCSGIFMLTEPLQRRRSHRA
jgi:hypothetical protein